MARRLLYAAAIALVFVGCSMQQSPPIPQSVGDASMKRAVPSHLQSVRRLCAKPRPGHVGCFGLVRTDVRYDRPPGRTAEVPPTKMSAAATAAYYGPLRPQDLQQAYHLPSATAGSGQIVGIVDAYDDPTAENDLARYRSDFGLPPCTTKNGCFAKLNENGEPSPLPQADGGWSGEISLDLDMVSAICPNCHIVLVEARTDRIKDLGPSVTVAYKAGARQISNSYGAPECVTTSSAKTACLSPLPFAKYYDIPRAIVTVATGDYSWFEGPEYPADFGSVIAVGGTSLYPFGNKRGWIETAWTNSGSSCSRYVKRPGWITSAARCPDGKRAIGDVSAVADPYTGVLVYLTYPFIKGHYYVIGGTSAASPIIASIYALAGNAASLQHGALLYKEPGAALTDVTVGKNGIPDTKNDAGQQCAPLAICVAQRGWDGPTGNGTPWGLEAF